MENNDNAKVYYFYDLGRAYYGAGQYESSSEYFKLACEKSEEKESLYLFYLALSYVYQLEKGNDAISWGETARLLEKAIFIDGYKEFYYTHLVVVYLASDRMAKAGEYMERYNRLTDRNHYRFLQLLLNVLYYSPDIKECRECFVRSNENNQNSMNGLVNFARHSLQAGLKSGSLHGDELKNRILELLA